MATLKLQPSDLVLRYRLAVGTSSPSRIYVPDGYIGTRLIVINRDTSNFVAVCDNLDGTVAVADTFKDTGQGFFLGACSDRIFSVADAKTITAISKGADASVTCVGHNFQTGNEVLISCAGMTQMNGQRVTVTVVDADTFTTGVNSTAYSTFTSGTARVKISAANATRAFLKSGSTSTLLPMWKVGGFSDHSVVCDGKPKTKVWAIDGAGPGVTKANPGVVTFSSAHDFVAGDKIILYGLTDMTSQNGVVHTVASVGTLSVTLSDDLSGATAQEDTGGYAQLAHSLVQLPDIKVYAGDTLDLPCYTQGFSILADTGSVNVQAIVLCERKG